MSLVDRDPQGLAGTASRVREVGGYGAALESDLSDRASVEAAVGPYLAGHPVDLLGEERRRRAFRADTLSTTDEQWDLTLAVNLTAMSLCRLVLPGMIERGGGVIINVSSVGGLVGLKHRVAYCASKAGVIGLTRAIAADHAAQGIRANAIAPGTVDTEWVDRMLSHDPDPEATRLTMQNRQSSTDRLVRRRSPAASPSWRVSRGASSTVRS